ncbi:MAG: hypothetical protein H6993_11000 [Pseudomonadales bacterium]|nr:hypothetical protein [Pseudomonadales bacterium]
MYRPLQTLLMYAALVIPDLCAMPIANATAREDTLREVLECRNRLAEATATADDATAGVACADAQQTYASDVWRGVMVQPAFEELDYTGISEFADILRTYVHPSAPVTLDTASLDAILAGLDRPPEPTQSWAQRILGWLRGLIPEQLTTGMGEWLEDVVKRLEAQGTTWRLLGLLVLGAGLIAVITLLLRELRVTRGTSRATPHASEMAEQPPANAADGSFAQLFPQLLEVLHRRHAITRPESLTHRELRRVIDTALRSESADAAMVCRVAEQVRYGKGAPTSLESEQFAVAGAHLLQVLGMPDSPP